MIWRNDTDVKFGSLLGIAGILLIPFALGGCSTATPVVSEWRNPAYASGSFQRVMVGGPSGDTSVRRSFEDEFVAQLNAAGIDALPSYRYIPENEGIDENKLRQAAQHTRADSVLFVRSVKVEQRTNYGYMGPDISFGIFGSNAGASWSGLPVGSGPSSYNEYTSETAFLDIGKNELVWTGTIRTTEPGNVRTAIKSYVEAVMKSLAPQNLFPKR